LEPGDEHGFQRLRYGEGLAIHFFHFEFEIGWQALGDRMTWIGDPETFAFARLAPGQPAWAAHQPLEDLREVAGMKHDQAHAFPHALGDALDDFVGNLTMRSMAPPYQDIRIGQR